MKETNKKRSFMKRLLMTFCIAVVAISTVLGSGATEVQAASKVKKAMTAYAKYLQKGTGTYKGGEIILSSFTMFDINNDGIKELVVYDESMNSFYVYGYCSGKVKCLGSTMRGGITFYPKKKIFGCDSSVTAGFNSGEYYKYDGKRVKELAWYSVEYDGVGGPFLGETYKVHGKKVTKKKFDKYINSLHLGKGKSSWDFKVHKNTAANRKKYLSVTSKKKKAPVGSIAINSKNFPDPYFRKYVSEHLDKKVDGKRDGYLTKKERLATKKIDIRYYLLKSVKGIEFFPNLTDLTCGGGIRNYVTELNISHNPKLIHLDCKGCSINTLDTSHNPNLEWLLCDGTNLSSLDLSHNPNLRWLVCNGTNLSSLDLSHNLKLREITCNENNLKELDLSHNSNLIELECAENDLSELNVSKNPKLEHLYCNENNLSTLDVSQNLELERLSCDKNNLSTLDVSQNVKLWSLSCSGNNLTEVNVSHNVELLYLYCSDNYISMLDVSQNPKLQRLDCSYNEIPTLDISNNRALIKQLKVDKQKSMKNGTFICDDNVDVIRSE